MIVLKAQWINKLYIISGAMPAYKNPKVQFKRLLFFASKYCQEQLFFPGFFIFIFMQVLWMQGIMNTRVMTD